MPSITIWVTDHFISQRVGMALKMGYGEDAALGLATSATPEQITATPLHIGYGILRGMDRVAELAAAQGKSWFHLDLGYTGPGHFDGNYRIGYKGTQSLFDARFAASAAAELAPMELKPWKTGSTYALICPPTDYVAAYYKIKDADWCAESAALAKQLGLPEKMRRKGDAQPLDEALDGAACVITFNSSVGWQALQNGIPCYSDIQNSTVGSWHGKRALESLDALKACDRQKLFDFMQASQLSLLEIQQGKIKDILARYSQPI
jgi:hypothetical protein